MPKKIIITGGSGLIGKEALPFLVNEGFEVYALTTKDINDKNIHWIKCNVFDNYMSYYIYLYYIRM